MLSLYVVYEPFLVVLYNVLAFKLDCYTVMVHYGQNCLYRFLIFAHLLTLFVDLRDFFSDLGSGGEKKGKKNL